MQRFIRLDVDFYGHFKFMRLRGKLKDAAYQVVPALWCAAAKFAPDGDLSKFSPKEVAALIGYQGKPQAMIRALRECGFLDDDMRLHDWLEHNSWHQFYHERARNAALRRWAKTQDTTQHEKTEQDMKRHQIKEHCLCNASRTASSTASSIEGKSPSSQDEPLDPEKEAMRQKRRQELIEVYEGKWKPSGERKGGA